MNLMEKYRSKLKEEPQGEGYLYPGEQSSSARPALQLITKDRQTIVGNDIMMGMDKKTQIWSNPYPVGTKEARNESIRQIEAARESR